MRNVYVAMPVHNSYMHASTTASLLASKDLLAQHGINLQSGGWLGDSLLASARNILLSKFLYDTDGTDLIFIDADISWNPHDLLKLLTYEVDFVAGLYRHKRLQESYPVNFLLGHGDQKGPLIEVEDVPMGFTRISRVALLRMFDAYRSRAYKHPASGDLPLCCLFEEPFVPGRGLVGEDYIFCKRWRSIGGKVLVDPDMTLTHHGDFGFTGNLGKWINASVTVPPFPVGKSGKPWPQEPEEIDGFCAFLKERGVKRYLEIGCRYGDTFDAVMTAIGGGHGVAVDLPGADGYERDGQAILEAAVEAHGGHCIIGNSRDPRVIAKVKELGPYDAILIDGDHSYDGAMIDWMNYGHLAPLVAFHDITAPQVQIETKRVWTELSRGRETKEFVKPGSQMGIGVLL